MNCDAWVVLRELLWLSISKFEIDDLFPVKAPMVLECFLSIGHGTLRYMLEEDQASQRFFHVTATGAIRSTLDRFR